MSKSKNKSFKGYYEHREKQSPKIKIPKAYSVNGYIIIGEDTAMYCKEMGMEVKELK